MVLPPTAKENCYTAAATSSSIATTIQLVFPMPEYIYVDLYLNDVFLILPDINTNYAGVDPKTEIFRFKIRQVKTGPSRYWHLKTFNVLINPSGGGTIYDFQNSSASYDITPGAWYMEVHFYQGDWYCNILNNLLS